MYNVYNVYNMYSVYNVYIVCIVYYIVYCIANSIMHIDLFVSLGRKEATKRVLVLVHGIYCMRMFPCKISLCYNSLHLHLAITDFDDGVGLTPSHI